MDASPALAARIYGGEIVKRSAIIVPAAAFSAIFASLIAFFCVANGILSAFFSASLLCLLCGATLSLAPLKVVFRWLLPFVVPLIFVHAFLNPGFSPDRTWIGGIRYSAEGLQFGVRISQGIALLAISASFFTFVNKTELIEFLLRRRVPLQLLLVGTLGISVSSTIKRRIETIYSAQQARGINVGPSIWNRAKAFPAILIPVTISTLLEADHRVPALSSRGLGSGPITPLEIVPYAPGQQAIIYFPFITLVIVLVVNWAAHV